MRFDITLTWSKGVALVMLIMAFVLDLIYKSGTVFMFSLPFVVFLITGKQWNDRKKEVQPE